VKEGSGGNVGGIVRDVGEVGPGVAAGERMSFWKREVMNGVAAEHIGMLIITPIEPSQSRCFIYVGKCLVGRASR
jgi:hypothetical protein